jgi:hypothetical protein
MSYWGAKAREHWQHHLPRRYAGLDDPERFFELLDEDASSYYQAIRDGLLEGVNPNDGTVSWADFLAKVSLADQTAHEIVSRELIYLPAEVGAQGEEDEAIDR